MKRLVVILLMMVYGLSSSGMTLHLHYCCGKLDKVELAPVSDQKCGGKMDRMSLKSLQAEAKGKKGCCRSQQLVLKVKDQKNTEAVKFLAPPAPAVKPGTTFRFNLPSEGKHLETTIFSPPPLSSPPLYLLHCVYRI